MYVATYSCNHYCHAACHPPHAGGIAKFIKHDVKESSGSNKNQAPTRQSGGTVAHVEEKPSIAEAVTRLSDGGLEKGPDSDEKDREAVIS